MVWNNKEYWIDFASGWLSGGVAVLVCQPLDTVLTRWQAGRSLVTGSLETRLLLHQFGVSSLWRGSSCMIGAVPFQNALLMGGYGLGKRLVVVDHDDDNDNKNNKNWIKYNAIFWGGCVGGILQSFLMSPVELWKVSQQTQLTTTTMTTTTGQPWWVLGGGTWQRGLGATLWRDGIPHGIWFVSYECAKDNLQKQTLLLPQQQHHEYTVPLVSGAIAAVVAWTVGYPFDLIKTRIQASLVPKTIWETARELRTEPGGLYRGFGLKLVRSVPFSMIGFVVYEQASKQLSQRLAAAI